MRRLTGALTGALAVVLLGACTSPDGDDVASTPESASTGTGTSTSATEQVDITITRPDWPSLVTDEVPPPTRQAPTLRDDPIRRATLAVTDIEGDRTIYVLGDDGRWRRLGFPWLTYIKEGSGTWPALGPTSLDSSGTRLAIPQDGHLVVVDLATGGFRRYLVPGLNGYAAWEDSNHVLVIASRRLHGSVVDLVTGRVTESRHRRTTRVLPDGRALTWGGRAGNDNVRFNELEWDDGRGTTSPGNNTLSATPLVRGDVAIGLHNPTHNQLNPDLRTGDPELDELLRTIDGVVAVDHVMDRVLGFLPLSESAGEPTSLLGWVGEAPVLGLVDQDDPERRTYVVTWDYETGGLVPLATMPTWYVAIGVPLDGPIAPVVSRPNWESLGATPVVGHPPAHVPLSSDPVERAAMALDFMRDGHPPYIQRPVIGLVPDGGSTQAPLTRS